MTDDLIPDIDRIIDRVVEELNGRLEGTLSEKDNFAVQVAIGKAAWRGVHSGIAAMGQQVNTEWSLRLGRLNEVAPQVDWPETITAPRLHESEEPDAWADRYGGEN